MKFALLLQGPHYFCVCTRAINMMLGLLLQTERLPCMVPAASYDG
jgi:hypothetical protein